MKTIIFKYIFIFFLLFILIACSTKKDTFLARNSHALSTEYNILYNGQVALDKGIQTIEAAETDNFWKILPIERMLVEENDSVQEKTKNPDFERAEAKATKAIQKHSMNIEGKEKNYQMDEAYMLLGKARYYDQRFIPALDAFNYILYKYPTSSTINTARIWREKTNMRLGNDAIVIKNINQILKTVKVDKQVYADANALLAEAFFNLNQNDSAIIKLKNAATFTKNNNNKARYRFILGQLYQEKEQRDSALFYYQEVIEMNRKGDRKYLIEAYAKKAELFNYETGNREAFIKRYNKLIDDRENRPFLDVLYYEMGVFYDKLKDQALAFDFYNASLRTNSKDSYLVASDYRNMGNIYFKNTEYTKAAKYYDSTLVNLNPKTREFISLSKKRENLDNVIKYEAIAQKNDSILKVIAFSPAERTVFYQKYINVLKETDQAKEKQEAKEAEKQENIQRSNNASTTSATIPDFTTFGPPPDASAKSVFYFYNPTTVAYGKLQFKKMFGNRTLDGSWRSALASINEAVADGSSLETAAPSDSIAAIKPQYTIAYYTDQLPTEPAKIEAIKKERDFAYYQLGLIYKENLKEYNLASEKLEDLLTFKPEQKLVLPAEYNLYKIYQIINPSKAEIVKNEIVKHYPDSRYAQIITNAKNGENFELSPNAVYNKQYELYEQEQFKIVLEAIDTLIQDYSGDEIVSKFELLKAYTLAKTEGLTAYKKALEALLINYPNTEEGKNAQKILMKEIPNLEKMEFTITDNNNWKILYKIPANDQNAITVIETQFKKFLNQENYMKLTLSVDKYNKTDSFVVIHSIQSEAYAFDLAKLFKEDKHYKIQQEPIIISSSNYTIVQIKKNIDAYNTLKNP